MTASHIAYGKEQLIRPEVMQAPAVWLASEALNGLNGRRTIAHFWVACRERRIWRTPVRRRGGHNCDGRGSSRDDKTGEVRALGV